MNRPNPESKWCASCSSFHPVTEFYTNKAATDGLAAYCRSCMRARAKKAYYKDVGQSRAAAASRMKRLRAA